MRRRVFLTGFGALSCGAFAAALAEQSPRSYRLGVLSPSSGLSAGKYMSALREQLASHGFVEGRNLGMEIRFSALGSQASLAAARELVALQPDALLACTTALALGAVTATSSVPIVFAWVGDPLASGIVKDLGRPGSNVTGISNRNFELMAKRLELLRELLPSSKRVAVIFGFRDAGVEKALAAAQHAAASLGLELLPVETGPDMLGGFKAVRAASDAVVVLTPFAMFGMHLTAAEIVRHAIEHRFPAIFLDAETVEAGGLMSYATNLSQDIRSAADLLARVLRGEKPEKLPVNQASKFELAVNLKTARAMGLTIPQSILVRADKVIE